MQLIRHTLYCLAIFAIPFCTLAAVFPSASELNAQVEKNGARFVLARIFGDADLEAHVYGQISLGSASWLELAAKLRRESDASLTTLLNGAVAEALVHAPYRVMPMLEQGPFTPASSCLPFLSEDELPATLLAKVTRLEKTMSKISSPRYASIKDQCLAIASENRRAIERLGRRGKSTP